MMLDEASKYASQVRGRCGVAAMSKLPRERNRVSVACFRQSLSDVVQVDSVPTWPPSMYLADATVRQDFVNKTRPHFIPRPRRFSGVNHMERADRT